MGSDPSTSADAGAKVVVRGLRKEFHSRQGRVVALEAVDLTVRSGEFVCIVGPSGCGKTTLLHALADLEEASEGTILLRRSARDRPLASMIFQETSALPWMTVRQNVSYGLRMRGVPRRERDAVVDRWLERTGLTRFARAYPYQLSGGMKQRVSIARAFANDPEVLLMDEPFANLDEQNRLLLQNELLGIWAESGKTVVFITHSIDEAILLGDRVVVMTAHPGSIKAELPIDLPRPRDVIESKADPRFGELHRDIWTLLRDEVVRAGATEASA